MNSMRHEQILAIFAQHHGYAQMKTLKRYGVHTSDVRRLVKAGRILKVKPGLYRLASLDATHQDYVDLCMAMPKAVICLHSALSYHDLTTASPTKIMVALPKGYHPARMIYPPSRAFHFSPQQYCVGIETVVLPTGSFRISCIEKSICDAFRFRNQLGSDVAQEALAGYLKRKGRDLNRLVRYARVCRVYTVMRPYIEARLT